VRLRTLTAALVALTALAACRAETREETGEIDTLADTTRRDPADAEITIGTETKRVVVPDVDVTDSSIRLGKDTVTMKVPTVKTKP
jgi:ABC-type enterochelin transport system substrate-binding protein